MKNNNNKQNIFLLSFTIVMIVIWIVSNLYHIAVSSTVPDDIRQTISPFDPKIDNQIFEKLKKKKNPDSFSATNEIQTLFQQEGSSSGKIGTESGTQ